MTMLGALANRTSRAREREPGSALREVSRGDDHAQHRGFHRLGLITALFIPDGWLPNEDLAELVGPMLTGLLLLLIGGTPAAGRSTASAVRSSAP